ncbi:family 1 glycosylhydrolase [Solwaraspora sp. WMMB335]|uniref:family 1 glycosylhydrolase n=1 Tax=Solwaraspora sp. WMMB335 TaxID=3404118 RepID=UPI003B928720
MLGYCHWAPLNNFEWAAGYHFHFGLHTVDRETSVRTPKPSTARYAAIATSRTLRWLFGPCAGMRRYAAGQVMPCGSR